MPGLPAPHRIDRSSSATKGIVAVKIEPISANEGCTRLWKPEIHFDGIFEGLGVQPIKGYFYTNLVGTLALAVGVRQDFGFAG